MSERLYQQYLSALKDESAPCLFLDIDALNSNIAWAIENAGGKKLRIATKSVRSVEVLRRILSSSTIFQGPMTYTLDEALWLRELGFKDILMGYPTTDSKALARLAQDPSEITLMVDLPEHLEFLESFSPREKFSVCLDVDLSMDLPGVRFGVYRSHLTDRETLWPLLARFKNSGKLQLTGLMGYEAQVAGVADANSPLVRKLKGLSIKQLRRRREDIFNAIKEAGYELKLVNGGGTGSLSSTREEECVTEMTVGSGFYAPGLFDHYRDFKLRPALAFTLPVVRTPAPDIITCLGGGHIASGAIGITKLPTPWLPEGLQFLKHEGAGEVQTPLRNQGSHQLKLGDLVIMRHAKAGEVCEHFNEIKLIERGKVTGTISTYRGEGKCFL